MPTISSRQQSSMWADNLWMLAAHSDQPRKDLQAAVAGWLQDKYPACKKRNVALHIANGLELRTFLNDHGYAKLDLAELLVGKTGLYGPLGRFKQGHGRLYLDCATASVGIRRKRGKLTSEGKLQFVDVTGEGLFNLEQVIADNSKNSLKILAERIEEMDAIEFFYLCAVAPDNWNEWARFGGTGKLAPYAAASGIRSRVHDRNLAVVRSCDEGYALYVRDYVSKVSNIDPKAADAEARLRALQPPDGPFRYPPAPGANERELADLAVAASTTSLEAWEAIRKKLDAIYGEQRGQVAWFKGSVTFDLSDALTALESHYGVTGKITLGFTADSTGEIKLAPTIRELTVKVVGQSVVTDPETGAIKNILMTGGVKKDEELGTGAASLTVKMEDDHLNFSVSTKVGPYGITMDSKGKVTVHTKLVDVSGSVHEGQVTLSREHSLKEALKDWIEDRGGQTPDWFKRMPDVKFRWELGARVGNEQSDIMRVIGKYPGFWDLRPRDEFKQLFWNSLDSEERAHLEVLGFDGPQSWDYMALPVACRDSWWKLTPAQKDASLRLPVASGDPYWVNFWKAMEKARQPVGDIQVSVRDAADQPIEGAEVKLDAKRAAGDEWIQWTGADGNALLQGVPAGVHEILVARQKGGAHQLFSGVRLNRGILLKYEAYLS